MDRLDDFGFSRISCIHTVVGSLVPPDLYPLLRHGSGVVLNTPLGIMSGFPMSVDPW